MLVYRITYMRSVPRPGARPWKWRETKDRVVQRHTKKKMISSAANILYRTVSAAGDHLVKFEIQSGDEWIHYELGYEGSTDVVTRAAIVERLTEVVEFHNVFYRGVR